MKKNKIRQKSIKEKEKKHIRVTSLKKCSHNLDHKDLHIKTNSGQRTYIGHANQRKKSIQCLVTKYKKRNNSVT